MLWSLKISIGFPWRLCRTLIFFLLFAILIQSWLLVMADNGVDLDKFTLLQFKSSVSSDPAGFLSSWNLSHGDHCSWYGVSCNSQSRVVSINISGADGSDGVFCSSLRGKSNTFSCSGLIRSPFSLNRFVKSCNGTVFGSEMAGWGRTACRMKGELSPFIGNLTELRVLSLSFNEFEGEIPAEIGLLGNLEVLELEGNLFTGLLPFEFGGLKALRVLNLGYNKIIGEIPSTLSGCVKLQILDLSGNGLNGTIPEFLGKSSDLRGLFLALNQLSGTVHDELGNHCDYLEHLDLSMNYLTGGIPSNFGNCNNLKSLLLFSNMFEDAIPPNLGKLSMLEALDVSRNSLSGPIPAELGNCLQLSVVVLSNLYDPLSLGDNSSTDPVIGFSNDGRDDYNCFRGGIPVTITALPKLRIIWAPRSTLEGEIPSNWGVCGNLEMVNLADNRFTGEIPTAFSRCKNLHYLELSSNKLTGELNEELPVPCMTMFDVSGNHLSGYIPRFLTNTCPQAPFENKHGVISNASAVQNDLAFAYSLFFACRTRTSISLPSSGSDDLAIFHNFNGNNFTGHVPPLPIANDKLEQRPIYVFLAGRNSLNGSLSGHLFDKCNDLNGLVANLSNNEISGEFPEGIGTMCKSLRLLDVAANLITGSIPSSFGLLLSLVSLDLSKNQLHGQIPMDLLRLKDLQHLSLAGNNLTGAIPTGLGQLSSLEVLELSLNSLSGEIPRDLSNLRKLTVLLLDHNNLSGQIPSGFANIPSLSVFNVSFNNLSGPIPTNSNSMTCNSALGNPLLRSCPMFLLSVPSADLQGQYVDSQHHADSPSRSMSQNNSGFNSIEIALITFTSAIVSVLVALVFLIVYTRKCRPRSSFQGSRSSFQGSGRREVIIFSDIGVPLTFEIVFQATGGFHTSNCIGHGGFGATYKAEISPGVLVAVKRLSVGRFQGVQQFSAEIRTLGRMRHPNLVTLIGYHASETEMFLIYNYLPGGNLEKFIQKRSERPIDWRILHKIALDIARALAYLHGQCVPRVLHRDIKPSNILLDNDFNAYLSDFGMARLLGTSETHATTNVTGTFGYVAPEYAMTCRVSDKADVYSFGVVLLELISDKKALDPSFSSYGNGFNIVAWACMLLRQGQAREFFTAGLWDAGPHDNLVETLHLAVMCTVDSISIRPSMKQVVQRFKQLQPPTC